MLEQSSEQLTRNIIKLVLNTVAILINSWLLLVLWRDPMKRFRNSPSFIITNLALADVVAAIGGLGDASSIFLCPVTGCVKTHTLFACIYFAGLQCSFLFIALLGFDRFLAIGYPYRYNMIFGRGYCYAIFCIIVWVIGWTISALVYYLEQDLGERNLIVPKLYTVYITVLAVVTAVIYPLNYYNYLRKKHGLRTATHRRAQQLNVTWVITAIVLFTALTPYICTLVYMMNCSECLLNPTYRKFWSNYQVAIPVLWLINPVIYAWRMPLYRKSSIAVVRSFLKILPARKESNGFSDALQRDNQRSSVRNGNLTNSTTGINDVYV